MTIKVHIANTEENNGKSLAVDVVEDGPNGAEVADRYVAAGGEFVETYVHAHQALVIREVE